MRYFIVRKEEFSGYECDGHLQTYIVAANSEKEAMDLLDTRSDYDKERGSNLFDYPQSAEELKLPDLKRIKKSRIIY